MNIDRQRRAANPKRSAAAQRDYYYSLLSYTCFKLFQQRIYYKDRRLSQLLLLAAGWLEISEIHEIINFIKIALNHERPQEPGKKYLWTLDIFENVYISSLF